MEAEHVWAFWLELHAARQSSGFGPQALSYTEIAAWQSLTARHLTPEEVALLRTIDEAFMTHEAEKARPADQPAPPERSEEEEEDDDDDADDEELDTL